MVPVPINPTIPLVGSGSKAIAMNLLSPMTFWSDVEKQVQYLALQLGFTPKNVAPLLQLSFVQFGRWVVIPRHGFPRLSDSQPKEELEYDYLLFCSNYNGQWDQYLDAFSSVYDWGLDGMWGKGCLNWVAATYVTSLKRYVRWNQAKRGNVPTDYYFCAYPDASNTDILAALDLRDKLGAFARDTPAGETPHAFDIRYRRLLRDVQHSLGSRGPSPVDGDLLAQQYDLFDGVSPPPFDQA